MNGTLWECWRKGLALDLSWLNGKLWLTKGWRSITKEGNLETITIAIRDMWELIFTASAPNHAKPQECRSRADKKSTKQVFKLLTLNLLSEWPSSRRYHSLTEGTVCACGFETLTTFNQSKKPSWLFLDFSERRARDGRKFTEQPVMMLSTNVKL